MLERISGVLVIGAALAMPMPLAAGRPNPASGFEQTVLLRHNVERARVGVAPMRWNASLAASAQRWANRLATTGELEHAPENPEAPEGENLWAGTAGHFAPEAMVDDWVREKRYYRHGVFPDNSTTGRVEDVGHYTQIIWRATLEMGCARARGAREDVLVCRYAEAGNYQGERPV